MKKIIKSFIIVLFIVFLSGCYSKEEKELAAQYKALGEENAKKLMELACNMKVKSFLH